MEIHFVREKYIFVMEIHYGLREIDVVRWEYIVV